MSSLRHPVTLARPGASRPRSDPPETFLNLPLLGLCVGVWAVIIGVGELLMTLF